MKILKLFISTLMVVLSLSAHATTGEQLLELATINGYLQPVTVTLARTTMDDSTIRKGSIRVYYSKKSSSSAASSASGGGGGGGPGWTTASPLQSSWTYYSKTYPDGWSPVAYRQTSDFTQTTTPLITEDRYTQNREYNAALNQYRNDGNPVRETRTYNAPVESRLVGVSVGPVSTNTSCSNWTPDESTVPKGQSFTQNRTCSSDYQQTYTFTIGYSWTDTWANGSDDYQSRTSNGTSEPTAPSDPTDPKDWVSAASTTTQWAAIGSHYTDWAPAAYRQKSDFVQSRTLMIDRERYVQNREFSPTLNQYRNVGAPVRETDSIVSSNEARNVGVSAGPLTETGPRVNCSALTPDVSTVKIGTSFTQTRSCTSTFSTTYSFSIGYSWSDPSNGPVTETTQAIGTKPWTWQAKQMVDFKQFVGASPQGTEYSGACAEGTPANSIVTVEGPMWLPLVYYYAQYCQYVP